MVRPFPSRGHARHANCCPEPFTRTRCGQRLSARTAKLTRAMPRRRLRNDSNLAAGRLYQLKSEGLKVASGHGPELAPSASHDLCRLDWIRQSGVHRRSPHLSHDQHLLKPLLHLVESHRVLSASLRSRDLNSSFRACIVIVSRACVLLQAFSSQLGPRA